MDIRGLSVWTARAVGVGLVMLAFFGVSAYWLYWHSTAELHLSGQRVEGTIVGHFSERDTSDIEFFHPVVTYAAPPGKRSGKRHELRDESLEAASESLAQRWKGKHRTLLIDRSDPGHAVAAATRSPTNPSDMMGNLFGTTFGVAVLLVGLGMLVGSFFDPKKIVTPFVTLAGVLFGLGVCIVGAATGYFGMLHATTYRTIQENGTEVQGTIVSFFHVGGKQGGVFPIVEYTDQQGEIFQAEFGQPRVGRESEARKWLGKSHTVRHHPKDPATVISHPDEVWLNDIAMPFIFGVLGYLAIPVGLVIVGMSLWGGRKINASRRGAAPSERHGTC